MKEQEEQTLLIDVHLTRGLLAVLALALVVACAVAYLAWGQERASAAGSPAPLLVTANMRQYYITPGTFSGAAALGACDSGYHMASLWEILEPSNLRYHTGKGWMVGDSGGGPPAGASGWVRTGAGGSSGGTAGFANCSAWTSSATEHSGTAVWLVAPWTSGLPDIYVWEVATPACDFAQRVWCVENVATATIYLPIVLRQ